MAQLWNVQAYHLSTPLVKPPFAMTTDQINSEEDRGSLKQTSPARLFDSFFMGGFECSTHRLRGGRRLDMIKASKHDRFVTRDYLRLRNEGMSAARDGLRWHLIEKSPGQYDFSSAMPMFDAARKTGVQVIWDLCHYGYPDGLDLFTSEFIDRFAGFARAFAHTWRQEFDEPPLVVPMNEISFWSWAGGDVAYLNPFERGRGFDFKVQLVRAAIEAMEEIWSVIPDARFIHAEPLINVIHHPSRPRDRGAAEAHRQSQYQAWDMLTGRMCQELGGSEKYVDVVGLNYYSTNQWFHHTGRKLKPGHKLYRPLREMLKEVFHRFKRPLFIAETGIEDDARPDWFRYVCDEVMAANTMGVPVGGICLYPILNHPGWDNNRHCYNGLWDYADKEGNREIYEPLAAEIRRQRAIFERDKEGFGFDAHAAA